MFGTKIASNLLGVIYACSNLEQRKAHNALLVTWVIESSPLWASESSPLWASC